VLATGVAVAIARWRPRWIGAGLPLALVLMLIAAWLVLDLRWQWNLARQVAVTARPYAGRDWREKHVAAEDGPLFEFIEKVRAELPPPPPRRFLGGAAAHFRGSAGRPPHACSWWPTRIISAPAAPIICIRTTCSSIRGTTRSRRRRRCDRAITSSCISGAESSSTRHKACCDGTTGSRCAPRRWSSSPAPRCSGCAEWTFPSFLPD